MGSSGPSNTTQTTKQELPVWAQPYAQQLLAMGAGAAGIRPRTTNAPTGSTPAPVTQREQPSYWGDRSYRPSGTVSGSPSAVSASPVPEAPFETPAVREFKTYPGQRIADFTPEQEQGLTMTAQRATAGSSLNKAAQGNLEATLRGDYMNANPYLDSVVKQGGEDVMARLAPYFKTSGSSGNTGLMELASGQLADSANNIRFQNYNNERGRQTQAATLAPSLAATDYTDLQSLLGVGDVRQGMNQSKLNQGYEDWLREYNYPLEQMDILSRALGGAVGGQGTSSASGPNPDESNRAAGAIGGAATGLGLAGQLGATGVGLPAGAILGLLAGGGFLG